MYHISAHMNSTQNEDPWILIRLQQLVVLTLVQTLHIFRKADSVEQVTFGASKTHV
jgi:hypothetical protein